MFSLLSRTLLGVVGASAVVLPLAAASPVAAEPTWTDLAPAAQPEANPLKGFIPFRGDYDTFPHTMEWSYFPVNAVFSQPGTFDWSTVDAALDEVKERGHQTAMRFYLDLPGQPSALPDYLVDGDLVETRPYDDYDNAGISVSPDYDDPDLVAAMTGFIAALGDKYDGDPRLGYLQVGLIGFWGEWHTYPYNGEDQPNWMASEATQATVLSAFADAFDETPIEVRTPTGINADLPIGYHDDSFAFTTKISDRGWHFMDDMVRFGTQDKWRRHSIGGELRPEIQLCIFTPSGCTGVDRPDPDADYDFAGSVEQTHATWMMNHRAFTPGYDAVTQATAIAASQSLGYAFRATRSTVPTDATDATEIGLEIANDGVAPFYRDWPMQVAAVDASGTVVWSQPTDWLVSGIPSGEARAFRATVDLSALPAGTYALVAQVPNAMEGGAPVRFGNSSQDQDADGWLTIGAVDAVDAAEPVPAPVPEPTPSEGGPGIGDDGGADDAGDEDAASLPGGDAAEPAAPGSAAPGSAPSLARTGVDGSAGVLTGAATLLLGLGAAFLVARRSRSRSSS